MFRSLVRYVVVLAVGGGSFGVAVKESVSMTAVIGIECLGEPGVAAGDQAEVCHEFARFLESSHPGTAFKVGHSAPPLMEVLIKAASARGLGLDVTFVNRDGARTAGKPLSVAFYDRASSVDMRQRFYAQFLKINPLPF
jgi:hypothetical protein